MSYIDVLKTFQKAELGSNHCFAPPYSQLTDGVSTTNRLVVLLALRQALGKGPIPEPYKDGRDTGFGRKTIATIGSSLVAFWHVSMSIGRRRTVSPRVPSMSQVA